MKKVYCQQGHPNEILACFCNRCGAALSKNVVTASQKIVKAEKIDEEYAAFLEFKKANRSSELVDEDEGGENVPIITQLKVKTKNSDPGKITLGNIINTAGPGEGQFQRPRNEVDINSFMEQRAKWMTSRNQLEV